MTRVSSSLDSASTYLAGTTYSDDTYSERPTVESTSLEPQVQREINSVELYVKYGLAGLIGAVPFVASKVGEGVVKISVFGTQTVREAISEIQGFDQVLNENSSKMIVTRIVESIFRAAIGIPAAIGGTLLFGGAVVFSKTQALIWEQDLIEHPQEERINTKLARYGASDKPLQDYQKLLATFFTPVLGPNLYRNAEGAECFNGTNSRISNELNALAAFGE